MFYPFPALYTELWQSEIGAETQQVHGRKSVSGEYDKYRVCIMIPYYQLNLFALK